MQALMQSKTHPTTTSFKMVNHNSPKRDCIFKSRKTRDRDGEGFYWEMFKIKIA